MQLKIRVSQNCLNTIKNYVSASPALNEEAAYLKVLCTKMVLVNVIYGLAFWKRDHCHCYNSHFTKLGNMARKNRINKEFLQQAWV